MVDLGAKNWQISHNFMKWPILNDGVKLMAVESGRHAVLHGAIVLNKWLARARPVADAKIGIKTNGKTCRGGQ